MLTAAPPKVDPPSRQAPAQAHPMRLDIQGLRALAVVLVVLSHAGIGQFAGGYVGVDVFFVISGFLITSLLLRELSSTGGISIRTFYARRALRLLPASTLVALVTLVGSWLFLSKVRFTEYAADAFSSVVYAVNFRLAATGTDYLDEGEPPSPFQHFWSLAVEEQFYLLWPVLLLVSWKLARSRRMLAVPLAALCVVSLALSVATTEGSASWAYFGSHTRIWELGVGALLALSVARLERLPARLAAPLTWLGLAAIVASALWFDNDTAFPGYHALLPVLGTALVLAGGCAPARGDARLLLARRPAVWVGGLSYGWYLWHWPLLLIGPEVLDRPAGPRTSLALCAVALLLAWATLHLVENPVRFHAAFRRRPGRALGVGVGLTAAAAGVTLTAAVFPPGIASGDSAPRLKEELAAAPDAQQRLNELLRDESVQRLPSNLSPPLTDVKDAESALYRENCHTGYDDTSAEPCVFGDPGGDRVAVLFGDSHAAQWFPALDALARENDWRLVTLTKASCKVADVTTIQNGEPYTPCDEWRADAVAEIGALDPDLVIASSSDSATPADEMADPRQGWTDAFRGTFDELAATGAEVAFLLDTPWPKDDPVECAAEESMELDRCANETPDALRDELLREAGETAARESGVSVIDPVPWLCTADGDCPVTVGDTFVYRDDNHMSEGYASALTPLLGARLDELPDR